MAEEKVTYDYSKLKGLIREHCGNQKTFADAIGIGITTLHSRLNNDTYFDQEEIRKANAVFGIDDPMMSDQIFFTRA